MTTSPPWGSFSSLDTQMPVGHFLLFALLLCAAAADRWDDNSVWKDYYHAIDTVHSASWRQSPAVHDVELVVFHPDNAQLDWCDETTVRVAHLAHPFSGFSVARAKVPSGDPVVMSRRVWVAEAHELARHLAAGVTRYPGMSPADYAVRLIGRDGRGLAKQQEFVALFVACTTGEPPPASVAVLPFVDMSKAGDQEYLGDGIAEEILGLLSQVDGLTVIARTSSFAYKGRNVDSRTVARELKVSHLLDGSVRVVGTEVRISVQLVDPESGEQLWAGSYEEPLSVETLFEIQDRVAMGVREALSSRILESSADGWRRLRAPANIEALNRYLEGQVFLRQIETDTALNLDQSAESAIERFEASIAADPGWAPAHVALAALCLGGATVPDRHRGQGNEPSPNGTLPLGLFPMPGAGFEPACLTAVDFKSTVFTGFTTRADARLSPLLPRRP